MGGKRILLEECNVRLLRTFATISAFINQAKGREQAAGRNILWTPKLIIQRT
jgi:hypothetical protein